MTNFMNDKMIFDRKMTTRLAITLFFVFAGLSSWAAGMHPDTIRLTHPTDLTSLFVIREARTFDQLHIPLPDGDADPIIIPEQIFTDSTEHYRAKALEYEQEVESRGAFIDNLNELSMLKLPVGITKDLAGIRYTVIVSKLKVTPTGSTIEAYFMLEIPQNNVKIAFRGSGIPFSNKGGFAGVGRLDLLGNYPVRINEKTLFTIAGMTSATGPSNSFVEFDCNGFKSLSIEGEIEFSRDLIIPEDENGKLKPAPERVKTSIVTVIQSWNDLLLGINLPPFQVRGLKGVGFEVQNAFMDWSDIANPSGMTFPTTYTSPLIAAGQPLLWQGFYLERLTVKLPASFAKKQADGRVAIGVEKMILDDQGFTGTVFAENVLTAGDMSGWAYTIDRVALDLVTNSVSGFEIAGKVSVPKIKMSSDSTTAANFGYLAQRNAEGQYTFAVSIGNSVRLPMLLAELNLTAGSSITVREGLDPQGNEKFFPTVVLNGSLTIKGLRNGLNARFNKISFEGLRISTEEPRFDITAVGLGGSGDQKVSNFPVVINGISVKKQNTRIGIGLNVTINIGGKPEEEGFGGTAALTVWSKEVSVPILGAGGQVIGTDTEHEYDDIELSGISINAQKKDVYTITGTINFFKDDPLYGSGFGGSVSGTINKFGGLAVNVIFGRKPTYRYWYADALVTLKTGVPLIPGALFATGFGGGFYYNMKQGDAATVTSTVGRTSSGIVYVPEENILGIKAIMTVGTARPEAMNGDVGLEVVMNRHGGINSITLTGNANFMSLAELADAKMKELAQSVAKGKLGEKLAGLMRGQVYGSMRMHFDNVNDVFHGTLDIYINVAAGLVRGVGTGNRAGWAVLHFEKTNWYVHIGTPDQPLGLEVARIFQSRSYFMLGQNLPGSPPPPSQVTEILGPIDLDYMRDMNALQSGTGFAFGLHFIVDTGDLRFLMFYGRFAAGTGVDFMLKDYGEGVHCAGSSGTIGIDGWYANGQAYAFVMGRIGIRVKLKFYKGDFDILSIGAAAVLQAKGPNPFWMKGVVGGYYSILGGMVKGTCRFEVTVGQDCRPVGEQNLLDDVNMIAGISPTANSADVDVFNTPQAAFNIPVGEIFEIRDMENRPHRFRATLDEFALYDGATPLTGTLQWNTTKDVVIFNGLDILPGNKELKARARLTFEEEAIGGWTKVRFEGRIVEEVVESKFRTGAAPDVIPPSNVALSYPIQDQAHFLSQEYNKGFIKLKRGQPYLFTPGPEWMQKVRMTSVGSASFIESDLSYDAGQAVVNFNLPSGFENSKIYRFEVLNIPRQNAAIDANVARVEREISTDAAASGSATLTTKAIEGELSQRDVKSLYSSSFRTSRYNTFQSKMAALRPGTTVRADVDINIFQLGAYVSGEELFDEAEIEGLMGAEKLIQMDAVLNGNLWYENHVYPLVYDGYPLQGWVTLKDRTNPERLGIPPSRDIYFQNPSPLMLRIENDELNTLPTTAYNQQNIRYNLMVPMVTDFRDMQLQIVNYLSRNPGGVTPRFTAMAMTRFPVIRQGGYRVRLQYVIPGVNRTPSSYEWTMTNTIPDN